MAQQTRLIFEVKHLVPVKALTKLIELARDLECELVSTVQVDTREAMPALEHKPLKALEHRPMRALDPAKSAILEKLRVEKVPIPRRTLIKELRSKGFAKNSVGPLCTELKKEGMIVNVKRGYWCLPPDGPKERAAKPAKEVPAKEVNEPA